MPQYPEFPGARAVFSVRTGSRGVVRVTGGDRIAFLTRIMSGQLPPAPGAAPTALLGPKGNLIAAAVATVTSEAVLLECEASREHALLVALDRYRISDDVDLSLADRSDFEIVCTDAAPTPEKPDSRPPGMGPRNRRRIHAQGVPAVVGPPPSFTPASGPGTTARSGTKFSTTARRSEANSEEQEYLRILAGEPRWEAELDERSLPLQSGLTSHVRLGRGCYIGQEYVARQAHRGRIPRLLRRLDFGGSVVPEIGAQVLVDGCCRWADHERHPPAGRLGTVRRLSPSRSSPPAFFPGPRSRSLPDSPPASPKSETTPVSDRHRAAARNQRRQRCALPARGPHRPSPTANQRGAWSAGLRPASRGSAKPAPTTLRHANATAASRIANPEQARGWSAGLRPASRGSAKPAPTTLRPPNATAASRIANREQARGWSAGLRPASRDSAKPAPTTLRPPNATAASRIANREQARGWSAGLRPASRGSAKPAPTTLRPPNVTAASRNANPEQARDLERRSLTGIARQRETSADDAAPSQRDCRIAHRQPRTSAGLERRSPTGIARQRETSADDTAPSQREGRTAHRQPRSAAPSQPRDHHPWGKLPAPREASQRPLPGLLQHPLLLRQAHNGEPAKGNAMNVPDPSGWPSSICRLTGPADPEIDACSGQQTPI